MVGEDLMDRNQHCSWAFFNHATGTCAIPLNTSIPGRQPQYGFTDWGNVYSFRSMHPGGGNFALADGSTRFVRELLPRANYLSACSISGNETLSIEN